MGPIFYPDNIPQHKTASPFSPLAIIRDADIIAFSGQGAMSPEGEVLGDTVTEQTEIIVANVTRKLAAVGATLSAVFRVTVYLADLAEWPEFNAVYGRLMPQPYATRTSVGVQLLAGMKVEIDFWAATKHA